MVVNASSRSASSGAMLSAGRQVVGSAPSNTLACNSALTGAAVAPYSPFSTPAVSFEIDL